MLSVYADKGHAVPIVQDVVVKPYARRWGLSSGSLQDGICL